MNAKTCDTCWNVIYDNMRQCFICEVTYGPIDLHDEACEKYEEL